MNRPGWYAGFGSRQRELHVTYRPALIGTKVP